MDTNSPCLPSQGGFLGLCHAFFPNVGEDGVTRQKKKYTSAWEAKIVPHHLSYFRLITIYGLIGLKLYLQRLLNLF